jgi:hypothetical protein
LDAAVQGAHILLLALLFSVTPCLGGKEADPKRPRSGSVA